MALRKSKKYIFTKLIATLVCLSADLYLRAADVTMSLVGLHLSGGIKERLFSSEFAKSKPGSKIEIGFDYEYQNNMFLFYTGAAFSWHKTTNSVIDTTYTFFDIKDTQSELHTLYYAFKHRKDAFSFYEIDMPIMAGFQYHFLYVMAGPKIGVAFSETYSPTVRLSTYADYPFADDDITTTDIHGIRENAQINYKKRHTDVRPFITLSTEIGLNLLKIKKYDNAIGYSNQIKVGVFFDYSLYPEHSKDKLNFYDIPIETTARYDFNQIVINPFLNTSEAHKMRVLNFVIGIRVAFLVDVSVMRKSRPCLSCF